jgi:subtilisin family serine protease
MKVIGSAVTLMALLVGGVNPYAYASTEKSENLISGFIVRYEPGVSPIARNGEPTGANLVKGKVFSEYLGGGLFALELESPVRTTLARAWVSRMVLDSRISQAEANFVVSQATVNPTTLRIPVVAKARAASSPRSLSAKTAVTFTSPQRARARLSWKAPTSRYGASIVGYRIQYSSNGGSSWKTLINNTGSSQTRAFVSDGLRAGVSYRFRVRAITNDGSGSNTIGASSNVASLVVRTAPKPVAVSARERTGPGNVGFLEQSISDRGGYSASKVRYRAIATAVDVEPVESSSCSATRCRFPSLLEDTSYTIEIFATNPRGTSSSKDAVPVDDYYFPLQWHLTGEFGISLPAAWKYSRGDGDKVVAVIDTGIRSHEQIENSLTRNEDGSIYGYDFVSDIENAADGDASDANPNDEGEDSFGVNLYHGTHVAGIIAAANDFVGTTGIAPNTKILPIRALGRTGGELKDLIQAIRWASGEKLPRIPINRFPVSVINLSLGSKEFAPCSSLLASVIDSALKKGITVVSAAGNEGRDSLSFPANCKGVVSVAATHSLGDLASYSNFGKGTFISAPGGEISVGSVEAPDSFGAIMSTWVNETELSDYRFAEGTSMAAPIVSGVVALMYSMQPAISPSSVRAILKESVKRFPDGSVCATNGGCGVGILNAHIALARTSVLK